MQNRIITMCCSICMLIPLVGNASAITVPPDVKDVADSAAELAKGVDYRKRFEQEEDETALSKQQMETEMAASWSTVVSLLEQAEKNRALLNANQGSCCSICSGTIIHMSKKSGSWKRKVEMPGPQLQPRSIMQRRLMMHR